MCAFKVETQILMRQEQSSHNFSRGCVCFACHGCCHLRWKCDIQNGSAQVFCIVLAGTLVGLIGLFSFHTAYAGLSMIILGPPIGFYIVHILKWHTLPGNDSGFTPNSHSNVHAWGRKLRWRYALLAFVFVTCVSCSNCE